MPVRPGKGASSGLRDELRFYTPLNISEMTKATDFTFCARFGQEKC